MKRCKNIGCSKLLSVPNDFDFCMTCNSGHGEQDSEIDPSNTTHNSEQSSGRDNDYWVAFVANPKRLEPCSVECEDLIELFQMSFQEGEAFKALWRNGMMRMGNGKPGDSHLRNAEKVAHFGCRMEVIEQRRDAKEL